MQKIEVKIPTILYQQLELIANNENMKLDDALTIDALQTMIMIEPSITDTVIQDPELNYYLMVFLPKSKIVT